MTHAANLATLAFKQEGQAAFAGLSGDRNPIHIDEVAARRGPAGGLVVFGVDAMLSALEVVLQRRGSLPPASRLRAQFLKFILVGARAEVVVGRETTEQIDIELRVADMAAAKISIGVGPLPPAEPSDLLVVAPIGLGAEPARPDLEHEALGEGRITPREGGQAGVLARYPLTCAWLGASRVEALALTSTVVGMVWPGDRSIFSELTVQVCQPADEPPGLAARARRPDLRSPRIEIEVAAAGLRGVLRALVRSEPVPTPLTAEMRHLAPSGAYAGARALVIGGSRGLGAVTAKLLALAGAEVGLTYALGRADAEAVAADISGACAESPTSVLHCDVSAPLSGEVLGWLGRCSHLYYFATPSIRATNGRTFDRQAFEDFNRVYVDAFARLVEAAMQNRDGRPLKILYPSSVYVEARPRGMGEYAMSKAAAEVLCTELARAHPGVRIRVERLARVLTDQTQGLVQVKADSAEQVLARLLFASKDQP